MLPLLHWRTLYFTLLHTTFDSLPAAFIPTSKLGVDSGRSCRSTIRATQSLQVKPSVPITPLPLGSLKSKLGKEGMTSSPASVPSFIFHDSPLIPAGGGRGRGMFAARLIRAGEVIVSEVPIVALKFSFISEDDSHQSPEDRPHEIPGRTIYEAFQALSSEDQSFWLTDLTHAATDDAMLYEIANDIDLEFKSPDEELEAGTIVAIYENNNYQAQGGLTVLCRSISGINHSCIPNARHAWDDDECLHIRALRDIPAGTEILVCYVSEIQSYASRAADLADYGFTCTCAACCPGTDYFTRSEHLRIELRTLWSSSMHLNPDRGLGVVATPVEVQIGMMARLLRLMDAEPAMDFFKAELEFELGSCYMEEDCAKEAKHHLRRASSLLTITDGNHDEMTRACKQDLEELTASTSAEYGPGY